jgi:gamma-glutamyl hercynylcysteine S-oxide synthase
MTDQAVSFRNASALELKDFLAQARVFTFDIFSVYVAAQSLTVPAQLGLNPPLWELGHIGWFQEHWLTRNLDRHKGVLCPFLPTLKPSLLATADGWYDSSRVHHQERWQLNLPILTATQTYVSDVLNCALDELTLEVASHDTPERCYLYWLCAAHELMHGEAFRYMAKRLDLPGFRQWADTRQVEAPIEGFVEGSFDASRFAFDNESQQQLIECSVHDLDQDPITWRQFEEFLRSDSARGMTQQNAQALYPDNPDSPVCHVTQLQAQAWCDWRGRALPSEGQWLSGIRRNAGRWGQVWEWTSSVFAPYPGFQPHPYKDCSEPWFDGKHFVLKGGSTFTHPAMKHPLYRNFFKAERNDVCTGFRSCAKT